MSDGRTGARGRWQSLLLKLYEALTRRDAPEPVDLIFVMAGRMERKPFGLELYRAGIAPALVLSVGRFEVSKMGKLDLGSAVAEELRTLRDKTEPDERHFFVKLDSSGVSIEKRTLPSWSTHGEILALRGYLEGGDARRVMIVSTDIHLRRVALTCARIFRGRNITFLYCPVSSGAGPGKDGWWTRPGDRRFVISETIKLAGYFVILSIPASLARRLLRLRA